MQAASSAAFFCLVTGSVTPVKQPCYAQFNGSAGIELF
jgi:hypothetical protein